MRSSVERGKFKRDIRKQQGLLDPVCQLFPRKKLDTERHDDRTYNLTSIGEGKVVVRFIGPALI